MEKLLLDFLEEVVSKGVEACDTTLRNIKIIYHVFGLTNAQQ